MNMGTQLRRAAMWYADRTAITCGNNSFTFRELNGRVNRLAQGLLGLSLRKGERVAFLSQNRHQIIEAYYACFKAGLVGVPLNARASIPEVVQLLNNSEASVLIVGEELVEQVAERQKEIMTVKHYVATSTSNETMINYETLLDNASSDEPATKVGLNDIATIDYTSGTTGGLKAAMSTHGNWISQARKQLLIPGIDLDKNSIMCHVAPLTHGTVTMVLPTLIRGGCNLIVSGFDPASLLETIEKKRVTHLMLVPTMINFLLTYPELAKFDLSSIKTIVYAASPMRVDKSMQAIKVFGPVLIQCYGLHESSGTLTYLPKEDHIHDGDENKIKKLSSAGIPIMESDVRVVDENGKDVKPGEIGEIVERGEDTMAGYWHDPELTAATIVDGWLHTRDMATVDEDGYIYIVDRKSDMIISGGFNIYPFEVEEVLCRHPDVVDAAVIGVPDDKWGEAVKAIVVLKAGAQVSEDQLIELCRQKLAAYKKPRSVEFVGDLPRNPTGKVLKRVLREKYWGGQQRMVH
ncbi:MAG: long-chain-fatty-acid--CoA ligase [Desulfobacteraceae bacterium]|nr:MAG: long-chain-fatty-acid--CoA ligase [Desulfobacteraceae bacterium]